MVNLKSCDVVYLVKDSEYNGELRYSLRSVCKNFPHRNIWFVGGLPKGIKPDFYQPVKQDGKTKYQNVRKLLEAILSNKHISNNFILFNDDFFVLKPIKKLPVYANGDLHDYIKYVEKVANVTHSQYISILNRTIEDLTKARLSINNYCLHIPMMINKIEARNVMNVFGRFNRSLYGNYIYYPDYAKQIKDVKIHNQIQVPSEDQLFASSSDATFNLGEVGNYIRNKFPDPCEYEYE